MRITLCGAAGEVTGSGYLVETKQARVLVDLGMFQGQGATFAKNKSLKPINVKRLDAVVVTHAHLDHTGRLPLLSRAGYKNPIHATPATTDLTKLILLDSAYLQEADTDRLNRRLQRQGKPAVEPLYLTRDVETLLPLFQPLSYHQSREIAPGISVKLVDAGHMLGSSSIEMKARESGVERTIVFSGDLGLKNTPLLRDPEPLHHADLVFLESTYGNRDHRSMDSTIREFREILSDAANARERVLIPAFAVGRSQQVIYYIAGFIRARAIPPIPIYLDSPMAIEASTLYHKYANLLDKEARQLKQEGHWQRDLATLRHTRTADESRALNNLRDAAVIISASGMCEGGRIVHHLKHNLWRPYVHLVFVGYQAKGTLGERILNGAQQVKIQGEPVQVKAKIHTLGGFSGHAGQTELLDWLGHLAGAHPRVALTHGETEPRAALQAKIEELFRLNVNCPTLGEVIELP